MNAAARVALFAAALALIFGAAALAGAAVDPDVRADDDEPDRHAQDEAHTSTGRPAEAGGEHTGVPEAGRDPAGLAAEDGGLRLVIDQQQFARGRRAELRFTIVDADGEALRAFEIEHARRMHLIVVRRDLTGFQHLHPSMSPDGTWVAEFELEHAGSYRLFADFTSGGVSRTLGADVHVGGAFAPRELPSVSDRAASAEGYEARLVERRGEVRFTIFSGGRRVEDLEPYLGARGHLVALREGDLAFLHVHPESEATEGGDIRFRVEYPSAGRYRLFLQFKHARRVRTAAFTQVREASNGD